MLLRTMRSSKRLSQLQHTRLFSAPKKAEKTTPLLFPFSSRVVGNCSIIIGDNTGRTLQDSFISFNHRNQTYQELTPKTAYEGDILITKLANLATSIHATLPKLAAIVFLQKIMEYLPAIFSWNEYYALSELTAIALLSHHDTDRAINLVQRVRPFASSYYQPGIGFSDTMLRSVSELQALAYILKGDYPAAHTITKDLLDSLHNYPYPSSVPESYLSRAYSILSLVEFLQEDFSAAIDHQHKAISILEKNPCKDSLRIILQYNLWAMHHSLAEVEQEDLAAKSLVEALEITYHHQDTDQLKSFIEQHTFALPQSSFSL